LINKKEKDMKDKKKVRKIWGETITSVIVAGSIIFPLFLYAVNFIALFALDITGNHISLAKR
jgi:hypothetical protein